MNKLLFCVAMVTFSSGATAQEARVIGFDRATLEQHRVAGDDVIEADDLREMAYFSGVRVNVKIDPGGNVVDARAERDRDLSERDVAPALAAVRKWKFRPFEYRGAPIIASGVISIAYRRKGVWANPDAAFPAIDHDNLKIELQRTACFGSCPDYLLSIDGQGNVVFETDPEPLEDASSVHRWFNGSGVLVHGVHHSRIDRAALDGLIDKFRAARFFGLRDGYRSGVTDNPTYLLRFSTGGHSWQVEDYVGPEVGMPMIAHALEDEIDRVTGSARWVSGDETTLPMLLAEGFDVRSGAAVRMAREAVGRGDVVAAALVEAGVPLELKVAGDGTMEPLGAALLRVGLRRGSPKLVAALIARGWVPRVSAKTLASDFADGAGGCDPATVQALVSAGVDPNGRSPKEERMTSPGGGTALHAAVTTYGPCSELKDRKPLIQALIAAGVDPNIPDADGRTPIFGIEDPELLTLMLASGARADRKDRHGRSAVFDSWTDVIVLTLLEAGADPRGKDEQGKTLRELARDHAMPATLAWLDAHKLP